MYICSQHSLILLNVGIAGYSQVNRCTYIHVHKGCIPEFMSTLPKIKEGWSL